MLSLERKSSIVILDAGSTVGRLTLLDGDLVHAVCNGTTGDLAAIALISSNPECIRVRRAIGPELRSVTRPIGQLVIEAMRLIDESVDPAVPEPTTSSHSLSDGYYRDLRNTIVKELCAVDSVSSVAIFNRSNPAQTERFTECSLAQLG